MLAILMYLQISLVIQNETLIAIKAPHGTTLEVPDPDEVCLSIWVTCYPFICLLIIQMPMHWVFKFHGSSSKAPHHPFDLFSHFNPHMLVVRGSSLVVSWCNLQFSFLSIEVFLEINRELKVMVISCLGGNWVRLLNTHIVAFRFCFEVPWDPLMSI